MRVLVWIAALFLSIGLFGASEAKASPAARPIFSSAVVADDELAEMRGTYAPFGRLTVRAVERVADNEARDAFRQTGGINRLWMDIWWSSTGAEMIAANVRSLTP